MIQFMAGVTGAAEAELAVSHGADIIDVIAGTADTSTVLRAVVAAVADARPVSATVSGAAHMPAEVADGVRALAQAGAQYIRIELPAGPQREPLIRSLAPLAGSVSFIGVFFAEGAADIDAAPALAQTMAECGFAGAMLDVARGTPGRLLDRLELGAIQRFIHAFHLHNMLAGLAGSLEAPDVPRLKPLAPDILAFRRALCASVGLARGQLDGASIGVIRALISGESAERALPPPRPDASAPNDLAPGQPAQAEPGETDRVFVHDFVLPVRIGAYGREHHQPQSVRFNVDVLVSRAGKAVEDMRDVFSYDVITDSIRMLVADQHIRFVETLAERIAELLLAHARVVSVTVRIEKLDIGPGTVGVEIVRGR